MKKTIRNILSLLLTLCMVLPMVACGGQGGEEEPAPEVDAGALFEVLRTTVKFDTELEDLSGSAKINFAGLPEGAKVVRYAGTSSFADELVWVALEKESDKDAAMKIVEKHLEESEDYCVRYQQDQVEKFDNAQIWSDSKNIIFCISADETAGDIVNHPEKYVKDSSPSATIGGAENDTTEQGNENQVTEPTTEPPTEPPVQIPTLTAQSTGISKYSSYMVVDHVGYEYYNYDDTVATYYAELVSRAANALEGETNVYSMVIPTAIGVVLPDNVDYDAEDQQARLEQIYGKMDSSVIPVNIFNKLMEHRDEYLYYRTDWHWTGTGAYYGYEKFCEVKGITPYTMDQRQEHISEGYVGLFSSGTTADDIYAYDPYYKDEVTMVYTDEYGNSAQCEVIRDGVSAYWYVFAAGDQPYIEFTNTAVTDGSVAIVVKESFGNALMSYLCDHYSKVYEIDYRTWRGNLVDFAREVGATDLIFANNIGAVRSGDRVAEMSNLVP